MRGVAVFHDETGARHGEIENLSSSGALVAIAGVPELANVELKLGIDTGWVRARTVRVEAHRIAVEFDHIEPALRASIEAAIEGALRAAARRPVLVVDGRNTRRHDLVSRLAARGMTPLAPRTPLEAIDLLTRAHLHVNVCLLAPSFGQSTAELRALVSDSFPWVSTADISDDLEDTVDRALEAWSDTDVARLSTAIA
jgi:hypothetical protein